MIHVDCPTNTTDLINGLFITINTTNKTFDYCDAYELLPDIQKVFYDELGLEAYSLKPKTLPPRCEDLDTLFIMGNLFSVYSIGLNKTGDKVHIHLWIYNLHSINMSYKIFHKSITSGLRKLKGISRKNEFGIKIKPCIDNIDAVIRRSDNGNQAVIDYVANKDYDT